VEGRLSLLDLSIIAAYLAGVLGLSWAVARRQWTGDDYFLAGRAFGGGPLAASLVANQASAISMIGAPAFVALREGGGLLWLQYELAVPLAMIALIVFVLPALRSVPGSSIYAFIERRFGVGSRRALAATFLVSRGLALGVVLYASAVVVAEAVGWPVERAILAVGIFSVAYTSLGGLAADVWSDVIQLVVLWVGTIVSAAYVFAHGGTAVIDAIPDERFQALVFSAPPGDPSPLTFWPMLLGGFFLYMSYYGCDQSQAQRLVAARSDRDARLALLLNGVIRFPVVLTYCIFGLLLAGLLQVDQSFAASMAARPADSLVPVFMMNYLPSGVRGLFFAAILAAAMSSIDSAMNSLAAVTLEDVFEIPPERQGIWLSRLTSLAWGTFAIVAGLQVAGGDRGVLEVVNQFGSAFYGPLLGVFLLGVFARSVTGGAALAGLVAGLAGNLALARWAPGMSWLWWNPIGLGATMGVALGISRSAVGFTMPIAGGREAAWLGAAWLAMFGLLVGTLV
jgi:SSS family solute:Na+ symporter